MRFRSLACASVAAIALLGTAVLAPAASASPSSDASDQLTLYALTNQARAAQGLAPLAADVLSGEVAQAWARQLAAQRTLAHNPALVAQIGSQVTPDWRRIGENVGYAPTVTAVQNAFMASPAHVANVLGDFNRVGIGAARDAYGTLWVVLDFVNGPPVQTVSPATFLPFASAPDFSSQQYGDLLGRPADPGGLAYWSSTMNAGISTPGQVVEGFMRSAEFAQRVSPLSRLYMAAFARIADYRGLVYWLSVEQAGLSVKQIADLFVTSPEFLLRYGNLSPSDFVSRVYENVLGRASDAGGMAYWSALLQGATLDRGGLVLLFSESAENQTRTAGTVNATLGYVGLLRRSPDPSGLAYWASQLQAGLPLSVFSATVLSSAEYAGRFS